MSHKLRVLAVAAALVSAAPLASYAQDHRSELGASLFGISHYQQFDEGFTAVAVPGSSFFTVTPGLYAAFSLGDKVQLSPQLGYNLISSDGESIHNLSLGGEVDYLFSGRAKSSPYIL